MKSIMLRSALLLATAILLALIAGRAFWVWLGESPFGMTGARIITTLLNALQWYDKETGLVTMCVGGGQGMALIMERLS